MTNFVQMSRGQCRGRGAISAIQLAIAAAAFVTLSASATLGGNEASVIVDQAALKATLVKTMNAGYTDYALTLPNAIVVHEFVNAAGQVFEVTWNGKGMRPDMQQILGVHFDQFNAPAKEKAVNEKHVTARRSDKVANDFEAHSAVHNRIFTGIAYLPSQLPSSLNGPLSVPVESPIPKAANPAK